MKKRDTLSVEPCGPVRSMIENELKKLCRPGHKPPRGALKKIVELCVVNSLGPKYPKLMDKFKVLKEQDHGAAR